MDNYKHLDLEYITGNIEEYVFEIPDYTCKISAEYKTWIFEWLFSQYIAIVYRLVQSRFDDDRYYIPSNLSNPLMMLCKKLKVFPWISMYYASSQLYGYS